MCSLRGRCFCYKGDAEILELSRRVDEVTSERDSLARRFSLVEHQLLDAKEDNVKHKDLCFGLVAALLRIRAEAEELVSLYEGLTASEDFREKKAFGVVSPAQPRAAGCFWPGPQRLTTEGVLEGGSSGVRSEGGYPGRGAFIDKGSLEDL